MTLKRKTVIIAGGSLSGLMNALLFKNMGYEVHVFERGATSDLQSQAAGIRAGPEVQAIIDQYAPNHRDYAINADVVEIMDAQGQVAEKLPTPAPLKLTTWKAVYDILKNALLEPDETALDATYQTRHMVQDLHDEGDNVSVTVMDLDSGIAKTMVADLVIAADGAHSTIRNKVMPEISPRYAGYVTWRGRVSETAISEETRDALRSRCVMLRVEDGYQISYYVPSDGDPESGKRDFVWIWYDDLPEHSQDFVETFTDIDGKKRNTTVQRGKMQPEVWKGVLKRTHSIKNPYFIELMEKIDEPFVSAIRDFKGTKSVFYGGKLLLVGDAFALCRPHGAGSTSQAALQTQLLAKVWKREMTLEQWEAECVEAAAKAAQFSLAMAQFFWHGKVASLLKPAVEPGTN